MNQSQHAGGTGDPPQTFPSRGQLIRDFTLPSSLGTPVTLSEYRDQSNLVLVLVDGSESTDSEILAELAKNYVQIQEEQAKVLAVLHCDRNRAAQIARRMNLPFPLLVDEDGRSFRAPGAHEGNSRTETTIYLADVFGEVFSVYGTADGQAVPEVSEIVKWLNLINRQCPECGHPEW